MFEKSKARIAQWDETNATFHKIHQHFQDNGNTYLIGVGCLAGGYFLRGKTAPDVVQTFTDSTDNIATVINRSKNVEVVIKYLNARNYNANPVQCLDTGERWASQIEASIAKHIAPYVMSQHLNGKIPNANGLHFERV